MARTVSPLRTNTLYYTYTYMKMYTQVRGKALHLVVDIEDDYVKRWKRQCLFRALYSISATGYTKSYAMIYKYFNNNTYNKQSLWSNLIYAFVKVRVLFFLSCVFHTSFQGKIGHNQSFPIILLPFNCSASLRINVITEINSTEPTMRMTETWQWRG